MVAAGAEAAALPSPAVETPTRIRRWTPTPTPTRTIRRWQPHCRLQQGLRRILRSPAQQEQRRRRRRTVVAAITGSGDAKAESAIASRGRSCGRSSKCNAAVADAAVTGGRSGTAVNVFAVAGSGAAGRNGGHGVAADALECGVAPVADPARATTAPPPRGGCSPSSGTSSQAPPRPAAIGNGGKRHHRCRQLTPSSPAIAAAAAGAVGVVTAFADRHDRA